MTSFQPGIITFAHSNALPASVSAARPILTVNRRSHFAASRSVRCCASRVKSMKKTGTKQFEEASAIAARGEDLDQDSRKGPTDDRLSEMAAGFREEASRKMGKAVSISRDSILRHRQKAPSTEAGQDTYAELRKLGEEGKIAIKNSRRALMQQLGRLERDGRISNDEQHALKDDIQEMTDEHVDEIQHVIEEKTKQLTSP